MGFYEDRILPHLVDLTLGTAEAEQYREQATRGLAGTVVEIGFGTGRNLGHYPATVTRVLAVEPSEKAWRMAQDRVVAAAVPVERVGLDGQALAIDDDVADAVLSTWTMCTIPDLDRALGEIRRVLRPGGRLQFVEHGLHPDPAVQRWQHRLDPLQRRLVGGCHLDRPIDALVTGAGFELQALTHHQMRAPRTFGYLYVGTAVPVG
jgi:ubiquinone/menaquinone biosynthesis C-methylase UbiE